MSQHISICYPLQSTEVTMLLWIVTQIMSTAAHAIGVCQPADLLAMQLEVLCHN